jgi:hypothetical protein
MLVGAILASVVLTTTFQNCGALRASKAKLSSSEQQALIKPMFATSSFSTESEFEVAGTTDDGVSTVPGTVQLINPETPVIDGEVCQVHNPTLNAFRDAIKTKAAAADQSVTIGELNGCEAGLIRFSAATVDQNGQLIKARKIDGYNQAHVGLYCPGYKETLGLLLRKFQNSGIRSKNAKTVHLCTFATDPATCTPTSPGYIAGVEYGQYGLQHRISNVNGNKDSKMAVDTKDIVAKIILPGGTFGTLDSCNKVALWSPLIIEKKFGANVKTLNPAQTQTWFDLSGTGVKNRISCVQNGAYVVLPDANGNVVNINNLFGNNTVGPDGRKSANGFEALGKHDEKYQMDPDYGVISPANRVWSHLRLWEDGNCDGVAQANEIQKLEAWGLTAIRWIDHVEMIDVDRYGNRTLQRNIAYTIGGRLRVFDIWFRDYNQP